MRVSGDLDVHSGGATFGDLPSRPAEAEDAARRMPALIPELAEPRPLSGRANRLLPAAALLTQLAATAQDLPATRGRRRAGIAEGSRLYRDADIALRPNRSRLLRVV